MAVVLAVTPCFLSAQRSGPKPSYPAAIRQVTIASSADRNLQSVLWFRAPDSAGQRPLLVALHTWGGSWSQGGGEVVYARWCLEQDWHFIHPDFRGPNSRPEACGSELMLTDIDDALRFACLEAAVDRNRIYLVGVSGGGHAAMLLAARRPGVWAGVSAWCGISDLAAWHGECGAKGRERYARNLERICGGAPGSSGEADLQFARRSPLTWLKRSPPGAPLDLNAGIRDGREGSVPFRHSLRAFDAVAAPGDRIGEAEIARFYEEMVPPPEWTEGPHDPSMEARKVRFEARSGAVRVRIFEGGHEIVHGAALNWLAQQRRGTEPVWELKPADVREVPAGSAASGT